MRRFSVSPYLVGFDPLRELLACSGESLKMGSRLSGDTHSSSILCSVHAPARVVGGSPPVNGHGVARQNRTTRRFCRARFVRGAVVVDRPSQSRSSPTLPKTCDGRPFCRQEVFTPTATTQRFCVVAVDEAVRRRLSRASTTIQSIAA